MEQDKLRTSVLLETYGGFLTEKQRGVMEMYADLDYSMGEIAENTGATRQAALDIITRSKAKLEECERVIGLLEKLEAMDSSLYEIERIAKDTYYQAELVRAAQGIRKLWGL